MPSYQSFASKKYIPFSSGIDFSSQKCPDAYPYSTTKNNISRESSNESIIKQQKKTNAAAVVALRAG